MNKYDEQIRSIGKNYKYSIIFVTRDFEKAVYLTNGVGIMEDGRFM